MKSLLLLFDALTYSFSISQLICVVMKCSRKKITACFLLMAVVSLLVPAKSILPLLTVYILMCLFGNWGTLCQTLYQSVTVVFILWLVVVTTSSVFMLLFPWWHNTTGFHFTMGSLLVVFSLLVRKCPPLLLEWLQLKKSAVYGVAIQCLVIIIQSVVLPLCYPAIACNRTFAILCLSLLLPLLAVILLFRHIMKKEQEEQDKQLRAKHQQEYSTQIQKQFDTVMELKHYYNNLYTSLCPCIRDKNMEGIALIFQRYITPIHERHVADTDFLSGIENPLLHNFMDITLERVETTLPGITLKYSIDGAFHLPDKLHLDIFQLMSIYLDNAIQELHRQAFGLLISLKMKYCRLLVLKCC